MALTMHVKLPWAGTFTATDCGMTSSVLLMIASMETCPFDYGGDDAPGRLDASLESSNAVEIKHCGLTPRVRFLASVDA